MRCRPVAVLARSLLAGLIAAGIGAAGAGATQPTVEMPYALLRALDKITARVTRLDVPVGETVTFGTLSVTVRACFGSRPEEAPENAAFLEIVDTPPGQVERLAFSGWMFSSSPSISAMDHAVYDVWVDHCAYEPEPEEPLEPPPPRLPIPENPPLPPPLPPQRQP
ncbi:MAG: DUF2155 domain-containing protein [Rhodospirillaceae bacterium]|nr:DUF2155 domain-containing protein [Rhodospirillaceae bacterium]